MGLIPLPSQVYPADTGLLYEIIKSINTLSEAVTKVTGISVFNGKTLPTNALQTVAASINVLNNQNVNAGETRSFTFDYPDFASEPIIVATPVLSGTNIQGRNITVMLQTTTANKAVGVVRFGESGLMTVNINVIAIGISPTYRS